MPFCVTEAARDELIEMLERVDAPDSRTARFVVRGDRLRLTIDQRRRGDVRVDHAGRTVLVLGPDVADLLDGQQLDKADLGSGGRLKRRGLTITAQGG
ncbi:hypothetical protein [Phycisphaera mikurensis]|uniref:Uncharacterized protein n=1 Tax=Phycisphaera mikurensis (strain NBRC 102666 / KCTC 22515 / FYK2301M01) TaxID=1142394 RepID=I0ID81_PHYMF|nr:hypothetical protein [Phycisphaera mikurensis]MBB6442344.1 hypothetical protein [Phycisphaera mikurensis]BAM03219.1 hypothetical protein PSMK_10600 [Phycisphaera mikurensis NBRC 102666]